MINLFGTNYKKIRLTINKKNKIANLLECSIFAQLSLLKSKLLLTFSSPFLKIRYKKKEKRLSSLIFLWIDSKGGEEGEWKTMTG